MTLNYDSERDKCFLSKNKKQGEWDFTGFFERPKYEKLKNYELIESIKRITKFQEAISKSSRSKKEKHYEKVELTEEEMKGKFLIKEVIIDLTNDVLDIYYEDLKIKCENILLELAADQIENMLEREVNKKTPYTCCKNKTERVKEPIIYSYNQHDYRELRPEEAIYQEYSILINNDNICTHIIIARPDERQLTIYQAKDEKAKILFSGAAILQPNGSFELVEFKKLSLNS